MDYQLSYRTEIEWFTGKCLFEKIVKKKPKKGSEDAKPIMIIQDVPSFFNFFYPFDVPEVLKLDYDVGSTIKGRIIPDALSWFSGEAAALDHNYGDTEFDDEEDEDDDDEDENEGVEEDEDIRKRDEVQRC